MVQDWPLQYCEILDKEVNCNIVEYFAKKQAATWWNILQSSPQEYCWISRKEANYNIVEYCAKKQAATWWKPPPSPFRPIWLLQPSSAPEILQTFANLSNLQNVAWQGWKWIFNNFAWCHFSLLTLFCSHFEAGRYLTVRSKYVNCQWLRRMSWTRHSSYRSIKQMFKVLLGFDFDTRFNLVIAERP